MCVYKDARAYWGVVKLSNAILYIMLVCYIHHVGLLRGWAEKAYCIFNSRYSFTCIQKERERER